MDLHGFADLNRATELVKTLDRSVSRAFPQMQKVLDRSLTIKEKEQFYNEINELILDGDLTKLTDGKTVDQFVKKLNKKGIDEKTSTEIVKTIDEARTAFANLMETTGKFNAPELKNILQERIKTSMKNTYKIFETNPVLGILLMAASTPTAKTRATISRTNAKTEKAMCWCAISSTSTITTTRRKRAT